VESFFKILILLRNFSFNTCYRGINMLQLCCIAEC